MRNTDDNNLLLDGKDAAAAGAREKIKAGHDHLHETEIGDLIAEPASKSVSELGLKPSKPGLIEALAPRLFGSSSKSAFLRRLLFMVAKEKAAADSGLKARMRDWAKEMGYGEAAKDYINAVSESSEPGDEIALELLVDELHLHVVLLHEDDGSVEKEIKWEGKPLAKLHLVRAASTFCTLIVPHLEGKQAMPADNVPEPPTDWVSPVVGERVEVDVEDDGWCSGEVVAVLPGQFKVLLKVAPNNSDGSVTPPPPLPMDDWLTWEEEGKEKEWRRIAPASPATAPASPTRLINDGHTDLSPLRADVDALTKRMAKAVPAPAVAPVGSGASELSLKPPEQLSKMGALLAQCSAVKVEGDQVVAETAACLAKCADKQGTLKARIHELESEEKQKEETRQKVKGLEASPLPAGFDIQRMLCAADSDLKQLQGEQMACHKALEEVQSLTEHLQQHEKHACQVRLAAMAPLIKELQGSAEALPAELKDFWDRAALAVVELRAEKDKATAKIAALQSKYQRAVAELEAEPNQVVQAATESLKMIGVVVVEAAGQLKACANDAALLDAPARATLHKGLVCAALGTHAAAEAKEELAPLLAAAEELQAAVKPKPRGSFLGAVGGFFGFGPLVGSKRARESE